MAASECHHRNASPAGFAEAPVDRADAALVGLVLHTGVFTCPDCGDLVVAVRLGPKRGRGAVWSTPFVALRLDGQAPALTASQGHPPVGLLHESEGPAPGRAGPRDATAGPALVLNSKPSRWSQEP